MKNSGDVLHGILRKKNVPKNVTHCAFTALQKFHSDHGLKHFCEFPNNISFLFPLQKYKPTQSATIVLTLWICIVQRTNCKVVFWFGAIARKGACTVISRSFARSVDIVAWPVQQVICILHIVESFRSYSTIEEK